ncbi:hypothetical protein [Vibrio owensii]|uniref:hypothetical protein n=1 Tax=Vibrio owensii TaxID=696485 RepID=UPI00039A9C05|nr:hypothetical protein [Vibrio owensii]
MNNFKKAALASLVLAGMAMGSAQAADPKASLTWTGEVPGVTAGDTLVITGVGGVEQIEKGTITANSDGTFTSSSIILEAHTNDGTPEAPVIGALQAATWSVNSPSISYGGAFDPTYAQNLVVFADGVRVVDTTNLLGAQAETVSLAVANETAVDGVEGEAVQATLTVVASAI